MNLICSLSAWKENHDAALAGIRDLGFDAVDLILIENWGIVTPSQLADDFDRHLDRVRAALDRYGLRAAAVNAAFSPQLHERSDEKENVRRRDRIRATCRFMNAMGIPVGAHYPGHIGDWKNDPEGVWRDTIDSLREIQEIAGEEGVTLGPELHFNTPFENPADARRLLAEIPGIPYTYEPSHFIIRGLDARTETADLLDGALHCHLRTAARDQIQTFPDPEGLPALDWMMESLKQRNYPGSVSIEYLPNTDFDVWQAIRILRERYE